MSSSKFFPSLTGLRAFEAVARLGGIRKAAKELGIDHAVVSRHIKTIENWLGVTLLTRGGSQFELTEIGRDYYRPIFEAITLVGSATESLMKAQERSSLKIWCVPGFAFLWLSERLGGFMAENPDIDLDFRPADQPPDFRARDVDADIRYLRSWEMADIQSQVYRLEFAEPLVFPVASPELKQSLGEIRTAADLFRAVLFHEENDREWREWFRLQEVECPGTLAGPRLWHAHLTLNGARRGQGVALGNSMLLQDDLAAGRLCRIDGSEVPFKPANLGAYALLAREDRWSSAPLARFRRWLSAAAVEYQKSTD